MGTQCSGGGGGGGGTVGQCEGSAREDCVSVRVDRVWVVQQCLGTCGKRVSEGRWCVGSAGVSRYMW